ncbi:MAG: DNA/RNA non-specific endonuclease, partial [Saprospiraceae bacterium]|nr:DNA/RNA non-specific endonuclease [Saprospiraceae bacterium]
TGSATYEDYRGSGYTRGHLVPAADRAYDPEAMEATFLMSNVSPQIGAFNGGVWRELEENVRDWARNSGELIIITGPIFNAKPQKFGNNRVAIPSHFFKVVLDVRNPMQGAGFIIPNRLSEDPLANYMLTIDGVEAETGLDFFHELLSPAIEDKTESTLSTEAWPIDPRRYQWRIEEWNRRR